jgi:pyrroloquinoline quinone (PQQ) biosynthesis protein C
VVGGVDGVLAAPRPVLGCFDFVGDDPTPRHFTVHVPIREYAGEDRDAHARILRALFAAGIDPAPFEHVVASFADRELEAGSGMLAYASFRGEAAGPRATVYLATEALAVAAPHEGSALLASVPFRPAALERELRRWEDEPITGHPFLQRLAREPSPLPVLAVLLHNIREATTREFARRLASVVARVEEDPICAVLAKQLNDELGDGDYTRAHRVLLERFVSGMERYAASDPPVAPGRALYRVLEELYVERDAYEGLGATLVMELYGKQVDQFFGDQLRREAELPASVMEWLTLHETLEEEHVNESVELAALVPPGPKRERALRGAREVARAGWAFFDGMMEAAWPR